MKIYQLQYTRLGKQGSNAGWQVTGGTKGTPQLVVNTFYKLASNLVSVGNSASMPGEALDIQIVEHYAYISHINYSSKNIGDDTDTRGVSFVHGYILRAEDYLELVKDPAHVTGMEDSCFDRNYEGKENASSCRRASVRPYGNRRDNKQPWNNKRAGAAVIVMCVRSFKFRKWISLHPVSKERKKSSLKTSAGQLHI